MANVLNITTKQYLECVNTPDYDPTVWIINPDLSAVSGVDQMYWYINTDLTVTPMTTDQINAAYLTTTIAAKQSAVTDCLNNTIFQNGFTYSGHLFDCNIQAQQNVTAMVTACSGLTTYPSGFAWRTKTNSFMSLPTLTSLVAFGMTMMNYVEECYAASWYIKDAIGTMTDVATINAYDITSGWPNPVIS